MMKKAQIKSEIVKSSLCLTLFNLLYNHQGGWELDEDIELAAGRETLEEAGVVGLLGDKLGEWIFKSKSQEKYHEGSMFPMLVTEVLDVWPEKNVRHRVWVSPNSLYLEKTCHNSFDNKLTLEIVSSVMT